MKFTAISYHDLKLRTWTAPQFVPGVDEESEKNFIEGITRTCKLGRVPTESVGLECFKIGEFDDNSGVYTVIEPKFLITLENLI